MKKYRIINILLVICILVFLVSGFFLGKYIWESRKHQSDFDDLAQLVEQNTLPPVETVPGQEPDPEVPVPSVDPYVTVTNAQTGEPMEILREYAPIYEKNPDTIGWMSLAGTKINYPVMYRPQDKDYYLHKDFNGDYSTHGCFYVQENADPLKPSDNQTIYGHNMKDGSMMKPLHGYEKESFFHEHPVIRFDSLTEHREFEVFAAFITTASQGKGFHYHEFVDAENEAQFDQYVFKCKDLSFYDTGITPEYGDKLITLSTCDYTMTNGRLVVVAKWTPPAK